LVSIRGNVDTRIKKVRSGEFDATVLAIAGLRRIGRESEAAEIFGAHQMVPAPGQGALAVELRTADVELAAVLGAIESAEDRLATTAERAVLRGLNASCATAIGAHASVADGQLQLTAELAVEATGESLRVTGSVSCDSYNLEAAEQLGQSLAVELLVSEIADRAALR
jgi:hydroxymethylbilane synthase